MANSTGTTMPEGTKQPATNISGADLANALGSGIDQASADNLLKDMQSTPNGLSADSMVKAIKGLPDGMVKMYNPNMDASRKVSEAGRYVSKMAIDIQVVKQSITDMKIDTPEVTDLQGNKEITASESTDIKLRINNYDAANSYTVVGSAGVTAPVQENGEWVFTATLPAVTGTSKLSKNIDNCS